MDAQGELKRSCYCGEVKEEHVGRELTLMGWVDRSRDMGGLLFLDLRDREGMVQVVVGAEPPELLEKAKALRPEHVVAVQGELVLRSEETINPEVPTGRIELRAKRILHLNTSRTPPFPIGERGSTAEETRLRYRYLDLRSGRLQRNLRLRHQFCLEVRRYLDEEGFLEIETPFLTRSTPEGARDFLVPSRLHPGHFYALPQSPQLFKQILMIGGLDRYFQIVRCFRDEDLRADRQPEFTQVDVEASFATMETVFELMEGLLERAFRIEGIEVERPFPRLTYDEALARYGTDRPDLRFDLELLELNEAFAETSFPIFRSVREEGGLFKGLRLSGRPPYSRKELEDLSEVVRSWGVPTLTWLRRSEEGVRSSLPKTVPQSELERVAREARVETGDLLLLAAGSPRVVHPALSALRTHLARRHDMIPAGRFRFLWVYDFPLMEWDEEEKRYFACHHPFTSPRDEDLDRLETDPASVKAKAYDVVLNGLEIGGGSLRIHRPDVQRRVFNALGITPEEAQAKFGFFLEALDYGAPPHGGIALGLDRIVMLLAGERSLREVIAFPKTARAVDLMSGSPSPVGAEQLRELHIRLRGEE